MDDKDINNIHAWNMFQKESASSADQNIIKKIVKHLLHKEEDGKSFSVTTPRNLLLDLLIEREGFTKQQAYWKVSKIYNKGVDAISKPYVDWGKQSSEEKKEEADRYFKSQSNFYDLEERQKKYKQRLEIIQQNEK
jgi:hypothetical protein